MLSIFKKFFVLISFFTVLSLAPLQEAKAMDPKVKALAMVAIYGTIGGALLGTASLAFGTKPRAILQGASLGLYAGLIFGSYILISHSMRKNDGENAEYPVDQEQEAYLLPQFKVMGGGQGFLTAYSEANPQYEQFRPLEDQVPRKDWGVLHSRQGLALYYPVVDVQF